MEHGIPSHDTFRRVFGLIDADAFETCFAAWAASHTASLKGEVIAIDGKTRYFLCSRPADDERLAEAIRRHWSIENGLHWVLDMTFGKDQSRVRDRTAARNWTVLRKIALNLLKGDSETRTSIRGRRKKAGWDDAYMAGLLTGSFMR